MEEVLKEIKVPKEIKEIKECRGTVEYKDFRMMGIKDNLVHKDFKDSKDSKE